MPTPTETWQDRRGMFQKGKELHQPGRKLSNQFGDPLRRASVGSNSSGTLEKTTSTEEPGQRRRVSSTSDDKSCIHPLLTLFLAQLVLRPLQQPHDRQTRQRRLQRASCQLHRDGGQQPRPRQRLVQPHVQGHGQASHDAQRCQDDGAEEERGEEGCHGVSLLHSPMLFGVR